MDSTEKGVGGFLNAEDICKILVTSKECGVYELELGPFKARLGAPPVPVLVPGAEPPKSALPPAELVQVQQQVEETSLIDEEIRLKEDQVANLLIEDPLAFEEMLAGSELEGAPRDGSGNEASDI